MPTESVLRCERSRCLNDRTFGYSCIFALDVFIFEFVFYYYTVNLDIRNEKNRINKSTLWNTTRKSRIFFCIYL